ncbi:MAG: O-antigen ligase family protein [Candidatus Acidiferrales bacterium]
MNISRRYLGDVFTIVVLTLATGAGTSVFLNNNTSKAVAEGNSLVQVVWAGIYVIVAIRAAKNYRAIVEMIRENKFLVALVLLAVLSTIWSEDPGLTLRRSAALVGTTLFGVDFAVRYSIRDQLRLLAIALGGIVALSVVVQVFFPGQIPTVDLAYPHAWVGLFEQKNVFARIVVLATMVILTAVRRSPGGILTAVLAVAAAIGLIVATESMTSFLALGGMMLVLLLAPTLRWTARVRRAVQLFGAVIAAPALYLLVHYRNSLTEMMGRNSSLTGRVQIWGYSLASIALKPILGYGYSAFWVASAEATRIDAALNWTVPHAHNAYIELALELGLVGLATYVVAYLLAIKRAAVFMRLEPGNSAKWPLVYLCFVFLHSFTENHFVVGNSIYWMLFVAAACSVTQVAPAFAWEDEDESEPAAEFGAPLVSS